jgi:hypothetical protein
VGSDTPRKFFSRGIRPRQVKCNNIRGNLAGHQTRRNLLRGVSDPAKICFEGYQTPQYKGCVSMFKLHVQVCIACLMHIHVQGACPCQFCMSITIPHIHVLAGCPCQWRLCMSMLHVRDDCTCWVYMLRVQAA